MLSICIPTYATDCRPLVGELLRQAADVDFPVELLVFDDGSPYPPPTHDLLTDDRLTYRELGRNRGRSVVRNRLGAAARHPWLLFLDADMAPNPTLLAQYAAALADLPPDEDNTVFVGGHHYAADPPPDRELRLHWTYGTHREAQSARLRNRHPYLAFHSANFLTPRALHQRHPFAEDITGYGHEDTLWGQQLQPLGATVRHLDNSAEHRGLDTRAAFLDKQRRAIENLRHLRQTHPELRTRLTDLADRFPGLARLAVQLPEDWLLERLTGQRPNLRALDLLKLKWYHESTGAAPAPDVE